MADFSIQELTNKDFTNWKCDIPQFIELIPSPICLLDQEGYFFIFI